jgi:cyclic pyranopterin phosphate synthase
MKSAADFSHIDPSGSVRMVDVSNKPLQQRRAVAVAVLACAPSTIRALRRVALPKGDALAVAQVAGIQAAKRTAELIPLCHPLSLTHVQVKFRLQRDRIQVECTAVAAAPTGVEMEALTGATVAALTLYDMCKAVDKALRIDGVRLLQKVKA